MKKYFVNDDLREKNEFWDLLNEAIENEVEWNLDDLIDEENEEIHVGSLVYSPSQVLRECDPVAYRCYGDDLINYFYEDDKYELERGCEVLRDSTTFRIEEEDEDED